MNLDFVMVVYSCNLAAIQPISVINKLLPTLVFLLVIQSLYAQKKPDSFLQKEYKVDTTKMIMGKVGLYVTPHQRNKKIWLIGSTSALLYAGSFVALNQAWYADYEKSPFHFFNDNKEWLQVDKIGHLWTSYQISRASTEAWRWTGLNEKKAVILGGISGVAYQTIIEIQDGFSKEWGFSWGDMGANVLGAGMYMLQELKWKEQHLSIKFSYWPYEYAGDLINRRNQFFGSSFSERILKDYNSQTYWLSGNIHDLFRASKWPAWLNLAIGYQADGMLGGRENVWVDSDGYVRERRDISRVRYFYFSPDVDFTKIKTNSKALRKFFFLLNAVKIPAPALGLDSKGKLTWHALKF